MIKDGIQQKRLEQPLNPDLRYYDATPSIEECAAALAQLQEAMAAQGSINQQLITLLGAALERIELLEQKGQSALILPPQLDS